MRIRSPSRRRFEPLAKELEALLGGRLDTGVAVAEMPIGCAGADAGAARCFVEAEAGRPVLRNQPASRCDQCFLEIAMMVAGPSERAVLSAPFHEVGLCQKLNRLCKALRHA